ncbi:MAG: Gfo/Idh/MocA family oxidoreductase, partial [Methanoregula sp.]|nr:Gfo/Idh/MocA family oxidoreductase [Methanoregula sp.]
ESGYVLETNLESSLQSGDYDAAFVCAPNHLHVPISQQVADAGLALFVEKPLSHTRKGIAPLLDSVRKKGLIAMAGFNLRFEPGLQYLKSTVDVSNVAFAKIECGSHMPAWRPNADYRSSYSARRSLGGGIILDDVHELDYACWLFGYPQKTASVFGRYSNFEIDVEDTADIHLGYPDKLVTLHMDYIQHRYTRTCKICFRDGVSVEWVYGDHVTEFNESVEHTFQYRDSFETNDMYKNEIAHFLACLDGGVMPESNLENAAKILDIALRAKRSSSEWRR